MTSNLNLIRTATRLLPLPFLMLLLGSVSHADSFLGLGELPGGAIESKGIRISADGSTVVGESESTLGTEAFMWTQATGIVGLGFLPPDQASDSRATGVSGDGGVISGDCGGAGPDQAVTWTSAGVVTNLGDFVTPPLQAVARAWGISDDASTAVGSATNGFNFEAVRWTSAGGPYGLGHLDGTHPGGLALNASADGSTIVGFGSIDDGTEGFRWTSAGGMEALGDLPGGLRMSVGRAVSDDGDTIVGRSISSDGSEAFIWTPGGGMVSLGSLSGGGPSSSSYDISSDGSIIVGFAYSSSGQSAFIWDAVNGMRSLQTHLERLGVDLGGWTLVSARGISADGKTIAGYGINPNGDTEAWIVELDDPTAPTPPPPVVMINNGLAPPNVANIIDGSAGPDQIDYHVRNLDCPPLWPAGSWDEACPNPGAATEAKDVPGFGPRDIYVWDTSRLISEGGFARTLIARGNSELIVSPTGGALGVNALDNSTVTLQKGADVVIYVSSADTATLIYDGDGFFSHFWASGSSHLVQRSGYADVLMACIDSAHVEQAGGGADEISVGGQCEADIYGDGANRLEAIDSARVTLRGGGISSTITSRNSAQVRILGTNFALDGVPVDIPTGGEVNIVAGQLSGTLMSGESFSTTIILSEQGEVILAFAPAVPAFGLTVRLLLVAVTIAVGAPLAVRTRAV